MASVESAGDKSIEVLLEEQAAYYRARASEYDDWFLRRGRYDWFYEPSVLEERLRSLGWSIEVRKTENYFLHGAEGFA